MRVIAGTAGGVPLAVPRTGAVRPTMDQVRGAIFSSMAERVVGARVLDLFAGAGGLGIEALSRGAAGVTFVDKSRAAAECIRANLEKTRLSGGKVICLDALAFLRQSPAAAYDLIFADPPYTTKGQPVDFASRLLAGGVAAALAADGMFILEKSPRHHLPAECPGWELLRRKQYGGTEVLFLQPSRGLP